MSDIVLQKNRTSFGGSMPLSGELAALFSATLASGKTLSVSFDLQDSPDGVNFSDYATQAATVVATGPAGGGTVSGQSAFNVNLSGARRYLRALMVPTLSATGTDTAVFVTSGVFAGFDRLAAGL